MRPCKKCNSALDDGFSFCPHCGASGEGKSGEAPESSATRRSQGGELASSLPGQVVNKAGSSIRTGCTGCLVIFGSIVLIGVVISVYISGPSRSTSERQNESNSRFGQQRQEGTSRDDDVKRLLADIIEKLTPDLKEHALDARQVVALYESNEVQADSLLKGKPILIRGQIERVAKDILDTPYITIGGSESRIGMVQCLFTKYAGFGTNGDLLGPIQETALRNLRPGQQVFLAGRVKGKLLNVIVEGCLIVKQ